MRNITAITEYLFDRIISKRSRRRTTIQVAAVSIGAALVGGVVHYVTVQPGDSLSAIASKACGNAGDWTGVYSQNSVVVGSNPNLIYPGQKLTFKCDAAAIQTALTSTQAPQPSSSQQTSGSYGHPNYCGDGDGDGYDVPCSSPYNQAASPPTYQQASYSSGTSSTYHGSGSMQACIIARESGGNPSIWNNSGHWGLYQFSASTWSAHGGNPADFGTASIAEQNQIYYNTVAQDGYSDWAPYDGC